MASDQILALNVLMRALEEPLKVYNRALRKAWATETDSDPFKAAVVKGNGALLEIEQVVRQWVAGHPLPAATPCSDPPCNHEETPGC
jgi:hypothetical protein